MYRTKDPEHLRPKQQGQIGTDRYKFKSVTFGPGIITNASITERWNELELENNLREYMDETLRAEAQVTIAVEGRADHVAATVLDRWEELREATLLGSYRRGQTMMWHLWNRSLPTKNELDLDEIFESSEAVCYGSFFLVPDQLPAAGTVLEDKNVTTFCIRAGASTDPQHRPSQSFTSAGPVIGKVYRHANPLSLLDTCMTGLSGSFSQLSRAQLDAFGFSAKTFAESVEWLVTVGAGLSKELSVNKTLAHARPKPPHWLSLNEQFGGSGSAGFASSQALKDLQPEARKAFAAEVSSPHGMAATVYKGAETNTGGDRSKLILSPSGISRYARLTSGSNAQPAIHEYSFLLASDAADILADTGGNSTYHTSFRLIDVEHKSFSLCYTFPDGNLIEHPVDARFFTDMNWDNLVKLAIGK